MDVDEGEGGPVLLNEKGVTGKPTAYDSIMGTPEWKAAKNRNDATGRVYSLEEKDQGAEYVVQYLWNDLKSQDLKKRFAGKMPLFIVVPSTSGANVLPIALAKRLVIDLGGEFIDGSDIAHTLHGVPMKDVPRADRPFIWREYVLHDVEWLRAKADGMATVVVEDVFSSGASANAFCHSLSEAGIQVATVAGLLGDSRLQAEPQLIQRLHKRLSASGINIKAKEVARVLSRGQVVTLIEDLNSITGDMKNGYVEIANKLRRILHQRATRHLEQDKWRAATFGIGHPARENDCGSISGERLPPVGRSPSDGSGARGNPENEPGSRDVNTIIDKDKGKGLSL